MKKLIITLIICYCAFAANAANVISVSSASGHPQDEVTLNISLANTDEIVAFQTEIPLGENISYVANSVTLNADRITNHIVSAAVVDGKLRIYAYSLSLTPFVGNSGVLVSFSLKLKNEPGDNAISLASSILSSASGTSLAYSYNNGNVTILSPKIRINTSIIDYGHVPIRSEYTATSSITNVGNEPLTISTISFDDAVFTCPGFAARTLQAGNSTSFTIKFSPIVKGKVNANALITSNSITGDATINLIADPFAVNELHINNVSGYCDSIVEIPMTVNNMENIVGFQIDMKLPSALEYVGFELSDRKTDHITAGTVFNDTVRLMAYSPTSSAFTGEDGVICTLSLRLHGLYGYYYLNPFKVILADPNGENVLSAKYDGYVNIRSPQITGNSSLDMGSSAVTETITKEYIVSNNGNAQLRIDNVVFDQSDWAVAETFPLIVEQYSNTTLHVSYSRELKGDFTATMKIYSNDPQNGLKNVALKGNRYEPNTLSIEADPFVLDGNNVAVTVSMDNYSDIVALQADFVYPFQDYSVAASDFHLTERFANHSLYAIAANDSVYKVFVFSMQNVVVTGHQGEILNIVMHPMGSPDNKEYSVSMKNIVLSDTNGANIFSGKDVTDTFTPAITQTTSLEQGWNWVSIYVEGKPQDLLKQLETSLDENGLIIQGLTAMTEYDGDPEEPWFGTLDDIGLFNDQMYLIKTSVACTIEITGAPADPATYEITINPGWNWIGFPCAEAIDVLTAMSDFTAENGDKIQALTGMTEYDDSDPDEPWFGTLETLEPVMGLLYFSNSNQVKMLRFNTGTKKLR